MGEEDCGMKSTQPNDVLIEREEECGGDQE
jgi:hypothetical protein